jgi:tetratricopeptide (TPR) repeat protein
MSTEKHENNPSTRFNILVAIVIAALAVVGALITKFESDASTLSGLASSDEQMDYYQAMGAQISGDADTNYEFGTAYQLWYEYDLLYKGALQRGDQETASTYQGLRDALTKTSDLLQAPYFIPETGQINLPRYKADTYTANVVELQERQRAASDVSSAWDEKSGTYVLQLTLLAVAGFLLGLSLMTSSRVTRLIFAGSGIPLVVVITAWAYMLSVQPVFDLRQTGAIPYYAQGVSLSEQRSWEAALEKFSQAIELAGEDHPYANAYIRRALVHSELGNFAAAVGDYEMALETGASNVNAAGGLVWALFQEGRFAQAVQVGRAALERAPDQLWLRHRVSMALLASGEAHSAAEEYRLVLDMAAQQIAREQALGGNASAILWQLKEASAQLEQLANLLEAGGSSPVSAAVGQAASVGQVARELSERLLAASVALEFGQDLSAAPVDASISSLDFNLSKTSDSRYVYKVDVRFKFDGLQAGQLLTLKVFRNGVEELAWAFSEPWSQAGSGVATITLSPTYADVYAIAPGTYVVKVYLNGQFVQQNSFAIGNETGLAQGDVQLDAFPDMYDAYDFASLDIFYTEEYDDYLAYFYTDLFFFEDFTDDWYFFYEYLWWDYDDYATDYYVSEVYCDPDDPTCDTTEYTCDPDFDEDCFIANTGSETYCDPDDPTCDSSEYTCDPDLDPDCVSADPYDEVYCDPDDPTCDTTEYTCDPDFDADCPAYEDPPPDEYYCDPDFDPDCTGEEPPPDEEYYEEEPPPGEYYCDPDFDPDCALVE